MHWRLGIAGVLLFWSGQVWHKDWNWDGNVDNGEGLGIVRSLRFWFGGRGLLRGWSGGFRRFGCACFDNNSA